MRTLIIGDIHGCYDELMELLEKVNLTENDFLLSLGDIVDRGNKSKEVYEYFLNRPNSKVLTGNHERKHQNGVLSYAQDIVKVQFGKDYEAFVKWTGTLEYYHETEDAIIVHAAFEHDKQLSEQREDVLCGSTAGEKYLEKKYAPETYWSDYYTGSKPVIYGHHVVGLAPKVLNNTFGIDTGCCHGDYLTAIELPGFKIHQVKAKKDYWKEEQKTWQIPVLKAKNWAEMTFTDIDKQLEKLAYIEEPAIKETLNALKVWKEQLQTLYPVIKSEIDALCQQLVKTHQENFSTAANEYPFKTYLFRSKGHNLRMEDLEKGLNTPDKIIAIAGILKINTIPTLWENH